MSRALLSRATLALVAALTLVAATPGPAGERPTVEPAAVAPAAVAPAGSFDPGRVDWRRIEYTASKFFVTATTAVEFVRNDPGVGEIILDTRVLGRRSVDATRFRLGDGVALTSSTVKESKHPYAKYYRFAERSVVMERAEPADPGEETVGPESWSRRRSESFETSSEACLRTLDPSVVLYLAAARRWRVGDPEFRTCTFSGGKFSFLVIRVEGEEDVRVDYEVELADGTVRQRRETVTALRLAVDAEPLEPSGEDRLEVLGLEDDVCMFVEAKSGVPLRFSGKMDNLGTVTVGLQRLVLR